LQQWADQHAVQSKPTASKSEPAVKFLIEAFDDLPDQDIVLAYEVFYDEKKAALFLTMPPNH
jgi:hypothetical protein